MLCAGRGLLITSAKLLAGPQKISSDVQWSSRGLMTIPLASILQDHFPPDQTDQYSFIRVKSNSRSKSLECGVKSPVDIQAWLYPVSVNFANEEDFSYPNDAEFSVVYEQGFWRVYLAENKPPSRKVFVSMHLDHDICNIYIYKG